MYARPGRKVETEKVHFDDMQELYPKLTRYCHFLSQDHWDGEDLAQETMYKAMKHYQGRIELNAALLKKIAHNLWMDQLRKRNREVIGFSSDEKEECEDYSSEALEELISELTSKQSVILTLKDAFRYQITEIAELFGMSETAVKAVLSRARKKLGKLASEEEIPSLVAAEDPEAVTSVVIQAIRSEDPSELIKLIPVFFPVETQPKLKLMNFSSPSSSLSMAA